METAKQESAGTVTPERPRALPILQFLSCVCLLSLLGSCAAPGEPTPPRPPVPQAIADLAVRQLGDGVLLTFTLPRRSVEGAVLAEPPAVEVYRGVPPAGATTGKPSTRLVFTVPSDLVAHYLREGRIELLDSWQPEELARHSGEQVIYLVRTRASKKRASEESNVADLRVYSVAEPITDLRAGVTQTAIELSWSPPERTSAGAPLRSLRGYRIYRAEVEPGAEGAAAQDPSKAKLRVPLELLAPAPSAVFLDQQFEFGHTYLYTVRSVVGSESNPAESADSSPLVITPRDLFPPAAPKGLVAIFVPATSSAPAHLELTWSINTETDLAGYNVYRSAQLDTLGQRLNAELLPAPVFHDMSVAPGERYTYRVTAVDRAGNESGPSEPMAAEVPEREP
ncbi:MAG TPA: fibronectin type III domain-containing protein [Candidatus Acidoferrales bacterium]|nr:fibronectin type III domain-containing protein [Candidatus Acidoferrales bacterium]